MPFPKLFVETLHQHKFQRLDASAVAQSCDEGFKFWRPQKAKATSGLYCRTLNVSTLGKTPKQHELPILKKAFPDTSHHEFEKFIRNHNQHLILEMS